MRILTLAAAIISLFLSVAEAQTKTALTAGELENVLKSPGFDPEMGTFESSGEPYASIKAKGYYFLVRAKECEVASCRLLLFFANFDLDRDPGFKDYIAVNSYNDRELYGRRYVFAKEQKVGIDFVLDLKGGVSIDYVRLNAERFPGMIAAFVEHYREEMDRE